MRVRGLKRFYLCAEYGPKTSHPMRVRGLKPRICAAYAPKPTSHPMRVRGLKPAKIHANANGICRTPCGCVD